MLFPAGRGIVYIALAKWGGRINIQPFRLPARPRSTGMAAVKLAATTAQEYSSVQFRSVVIPDTCTIRTRVRIAPQQQPIPRIIDGGCCSPERDSIQGGI